MTNFLSNNDPEDLPEVLPPVIDVTSFDSQQTRAVPAHVKPLPDSMYYCPEKTKKTKKTKKTGGKKMEEEEKAESSPFTPFSPAESSPLGHFAQSSSALERSPHSSQEAGLSTR